MGKKLKVGKQRKDKYYHMAKEAGYRSRAAFKLIQLNKRFEFLQKSRALVDLCAAPGGWMQVATQHMPVSSIRIGIDLVPIKPVHNCIALQGDITTEKARQMIKRELQTWEADCVLHDGAPNVGLNWQHDAFQQNCLTLSALKLATQILTKNGYFVTKVFRSNDYQSLITVFEKLFRKVHVWKPAASRLESAEIFVVCEKYVKPQKVAPELLDPKKVFSEAAVQEKPSNPELMLQTRKKEKKARAEGYETDDLAVFKSCTATEFIHCRDYLELLSKTNKIILDDKRWEEDAATTEEVRHCIEDIKVCGPRELRNILQWRKKLLKGVSADDEDGQVVDDEEAMEVDPDKLEEDELAKVDEQIARARAEDKSALKKKKKKLLKEKSKALKQKNLKMVHEGDPGMVGEEEDLFSIKRLAKAKQLAAVEASREEPSEPHGTLKYDNDSGDESADDSEDADSDQFETYEGHSFGGTTDEEDEESGLIHTEESGLSPELKRKRRADAWFSRCEEGITEMLDEDDDDALCSVERFLSRKAPHAQNLYENTVEFNKEKDEKAEMEVSGPMHDASKFDGEEESDEEFVDADKRTAVRGNTAAKVQKEGSAKKRRLAPELLALGEKMIYSSKTRRDLEDWAWNRYTNNDEGLPDWFVEDEKQHYRKELPVTKAEVDAYKERLKELNARPIKKVAEAQARKRRRQLMKLHRAKKKAEAIVENENMEHGEKLREMKKAYSKAALRDKKEVSYQVMTKGKRGRVSRPSGLYKVVDARLKKDNRRDKADKRSKNWKRMSPAARKAEMEKSRKKRSARKSDRATNRRMRRGKPV